ncbi:MarR family winged helix-turn-helix transcriptional regulator [Paenibacillus apiarius]|uniref:MarR family transcriptional regulator n=1 Tax=Paenibacillus apiarius TaxID=46240 RepID=A0ABT4DY98_9BACL|nr:MarR family transcriptional regulator [Paenibacillus apiarius]MCY9517835.1 MarR family transcriptional regulator [Paenibacillus apiarius]MCY9522311.1 MarR family transcriptional regulator [Paenibacillus apiarius]MCY9555090.1 MarR family transcriptional regulator [Paenibacillus apiarius]MCY9558220.1 MarR family transcriptional regulator [Paenibacillus apiarius]MCY9684620.1 MarR family transcriptional regulator [Paenibacillus apiarius]
MRKKIEKEHAGEQQLPRLGVAPYLELMRNTASEDTNQASAHMGLLLLWIGDNIQDMMDLNLSSFGITESKLDLLLLLILHQDKEGITPSSIAARLGIRRASATALLDWLEKRNWIERQPNENNRRMVHVRITPEGRNLVDQILPTFWSTCESFISDLEVEEQAVLQKIVMKLNGSLERRLGVGR